MTRNRMHHHVASRPFDKLISSCLIIDRLRLILLKRENHCRSPPATSSANIVVQIDGQNINIDDSNMTSLNYSERTLAIYKCKNPKPNATENQQSWRCNRKNNTYSWEKIGPNTTDLFCDGTFYT